MFNISNVKCCICYRVVYYSRQLYYVEQISVKRYILILQGCASSPNDSDQQRRLRSAAEDLRAATNIAASNALKKKLIRRLEVSFKVLYTYL